MNLKHYKHSHEWKSNARGYDVEGTHYPGVTTILQATKPTEDKKALEAWKKRTPKATQQANLDRGTAVHAEIEHFLKTGEYLPNTPFKCYLDGMKGVLEQITKVHLVEGAVWHPDGYAGTIDAGVEIYGQNVLADWKTSNRFKSSKDVMDYKIQTAAYCGAWNHVYPHFKINKSMILVGVKNEVCQKFMIEPDEMMELWDKWKQRLALYKTLVSAA